MHYRDALWGPIALELLSKNEKSIWVLLENLKQLTIHHFVPPGAVFGANNCPHLIE